MRRAALGLFLGLILSTAAFGQQNGMCGGGNCVAPTAPNGTNNNQIATTAFVQAASGGGSIALPSGQLLVGSVSNVATARAISGAGDCTTSLSNVGVFTFTCTKTNGVAFAASATTDTTSATNISAGTLNTARLPSPFTSGTASGNTSKFATVTGAPATNDCAKFDASGNVTTNGAACASGGTPGGTSGQGQYNSSGSFAGYTMSGDCTIVFSTGAITCTKTSGTNLGALATVAPGTGVATALAVNIGSAGAPVLLNGAGGTPSAINLTNGSALPDSALTSNVPLKNGTNVYTGTNTFGSVFGTVTSQSGTTYTLTAADCGTEIAFTNAAAVTVTIPATLTTGCNIAVLQTTSAGQVSVNGSAVSAATLHSAHSYTKTFAQWAVIGINIYTTGVAVLTGDGA